MKIEIIKADITELKADAIVNAANPFLNGGGGVDGAIHKKGGKDLLKECLEIQKTRFPNGMPTGDAVYTKAYGLPAKFVIHTVGPIFRRDDIDLLRSCYVNSLRIAEMLGCETIAIPAISTGVYGVPIEISAEIVFQLLKNYESFILKILILVLHSEKDFLQYKKKFFEIFEKIG